MTDHFEKESAAVTALRNCFADGALMTPRDGNGNTVDLIRAIASHFGAPGIPLSPSGMEIKESLKGTRRLVLVLIDGLGVNLLNRLGPTSFFRSCSFRELRALAPSTTSCVLTALTTGAYPSEHAITGWFTHLPEFERTVIPLPFTDRLSGRPLREHGLDPGMVFPLRSFLPRISAKTQLLFPSEYVNSTYTHYWRDGLTAEGFDEISGAVDRVIAQFDDSEPGFTYVYIPLVDSVSHEFGPGSEEALAAARTVESAMERMAEKAPPGTRLLFTADHGQIHIPLATRFLLFDGDPMLELLQAPPSGEDRFPLFHVKPGCEESFREHFNERFGEKFFLLSIDEMEKLRIFGPGPLSAIARRRFGDFAAVATGPWALGYCPPEKDPAVHHLGRHGGLSPDEMRIPLLWQ